MSSALAFKRDFQAKYGANNTPNFVEASHKDALMMAQGELKFLFVYLHSPSHDEVPAFCRDVLASPAVASFLNDNFVSWAGDIRRTDAFQLAAGIAPSTFPYVALLSSVNSRVSLVMTCEGAVTADRLLSLLANALENSEATMQQARNHRAEQDSNRRIREEQDAAFMESLAADAAREEAATAAAAEADRARAEEEAAARREAEEAESARRAEEDRQAAIERRREEKAAALAQEPEAGTGVCKVGMRLPDGSRKERRFLSSAQVSEVFDFVDTLEGVSTLMHYSLVSNFPRRVFKRNTDTALSLVDAGLHPQAMLFVQSEDE